MLEPNTCVPLQSERRTHALLKLRFTSVRMRDVLHLVLGRLLVALLGYDDVGLVVVGA